MTAEKVAKDKFAVVLLAAGASSRFGSCKLAAKLDGKAVIQHSLEKINKVFEHCHVVLGCHEDLISPLLNSNNIITNNNWQSGLSSSIAEACKVLDNYSGILFILADQYNLSTNFLNELKINIEKNPLRIIATQYKNNKAAYGPPVYFPNSYFEELRQQRGEYGAKALLKKYHNEVHWLINPEAALDIDFPEDLINASSKID